MNEDETTEEIREPKFEEVWVDGKKHYADWYNKQISAFEDGREPMSFDFLTKKQLNQVYWEFRKYDKHIKIHKNQYNYQFR